MTRRIYDGYRREEATRLDIRQWFEEHMDDPDLASAVTEAMPSLDYGQLATKTDVANLGIELRSEMGELRIELKEEMHSLRNDLTGSMATMQVSMMRWMITSQLTTIAVVGGLLAYLV